ncbi:MAG: response regulator [Polyangiaceae bacterium]|jgi:two-component system KDP operon response regulator KdpE|nr:response regulator [Polyangiaceae bacterium]
MTTEATLLLIEDEPQVRRFLRNTLPAHGYRLLEAETGAEGLQKASEHTPEVILLDLGLPDIDGTEVARRLREWSKAPIIVLSARGQETDKVEALDAGADDYLTKPFGTAELLARIRVALRRRQPADPGEPLFTLGELRVDFGRRQVFVGEREVHLTPIEYKLLATLVQNAGRVVTHAQLLKEVWGPRHTTHVQYVRVYMGQLRHKLESDPARPRYLMTESGVGYRLRVP